MKPRSALAIEVATMVLLTIGYVLLLRSARSDLDRCESELYGRLRLPAEPPDWLDPPR